MEENSKLTIRAMSINTDNQLQVVAGGSGQLKESGIENNGSITIKTQPATLEKGVLTTGDRKINVSYDEKAFEEVRQYRKTVVNPQGKAKNGKEDTPIK